MVPIISNKKANLGSESLMWIMVFLLVGLIIFGFVLVISLHYSKQCDIRPIEKKIMVEKAYNCVTDNGYFNPELFNEEKLKECMDLDHDINKELALELIYSPLDNEENINKVFLGYDFALLLCETKQKIEGKVPVCSKQMFFVPSKEK